MSTAGTSRFRAVRVSIDDRAFTFGDGVYAVY
jgi:hypothetical protein